MYPIHLTSTGKGYESIKEFEQNFLQICETHRKNNRALCFAFILYRERDAHIPAVLCNDKFWNALNDISGEYLTVFSFKKEEEGRFFEYAHRIPTILRPSAASDKLIEKYFAFRERVSYPSILFFQVAGEQIIDSFVVELKEEESEKSFLEIKHIMELAEKALMQISESSKANHAEIFNQVRMSIEHEFAIKYLKKGVSNVKRVVGLTASLRHFLGSP